MLETALLARRAVTTDPCSGFYVNFLRLHWRDLHLAKPLLRHFRLRLLLAVFDEIVQLTIKRKCPHTKKNQIYSARLENSNSLVFAYSCMSSSLSAKRLSFFLETVLSLRRHFRSNLQNQFRELQQDPKSPIFIPFVFPISTVERGKFVTQPAYCRTIP